MKKLLLLFTALTGIIVLATSFIPGDSVSTKIYPELEAYFKSVETKEFNKEHLNTLATIKNDIFSSRLDYEDWNLVFYCSENTFRSQASQVFAQTLCYAKNHRKMKVFSAGLSSGEISPGLINYLSKIGYRITKGQQGNNEIFEVRFSDKADPIILFSKTANDKSLPIKDATSVIVCDAAKETDCKNIATASKPLNLPFTKVLLTDQDEKITSTLKSIAAEMVYVTSK